MPEQTWVTEGQRRWALSASTIGFVASFAL